MEFVKKNSLYITLGGIVVALIGLFLPFYKISLFGFSTSVSLFDSGHGKIVLIALIVAAVLAYLKKYKFTLIPLVISAGFIIYNVIDVSKAKLGSLGIGAILLILGAAVAIAVTAINFKEN